MLARLKEKNGVLPFNDRVEPEIIRREFNLSKNAFKRAVGHLLKRRKSRSKRRFYPFKIKDKGRFDMKKVISTTNAPAAIGPYSQAIEVNGMVFASGQIPVNPATGEIPEESRLRQSRFLNNVKNLLAAAGASMEQVVKTTVFIQNMDDFGKVNEIYAKYFEGACPARSCVEVSKLPKGVLMEMEAIAAK